MFNKKTIFSILLLIILIILSFFTVKEIKRLYQVSKNKQSIYNIDISSPFSLNKIVYFSNCDAKTKINPNTSFTIADLYQYTDIAIFINNNSNGNFTAENTLKSVNLSNIEFKLPPSIGTPNLYYKNIHDFASNKYDDTQKIENNLDFDISSKNEIDYSKPVLFNNCANPITLCYVNSNIKSDYTLTDNISDISYNGSLLKHCSVTLNSIACKLSFLITIVNNLDEKYTCPVILTIPLSTESTTIYDGSLIITDMTNYKFIKQS